MSLGVILSLLVFLVFVVVIVVGFGCFSVLFWGREVQEGHV